MGYYWVTTVMTDVCYEAISIQVAGIPGSFQAKRLGLAKSSYRLPLRKSDE